MTSASLNRHSREGGNPFGSFTLAPCLCPLCAHYMRVFDKAVSSRHIAAPSSHSNPRRQDGRSRRAHAVYPEFPYLLRSLADERLGECAAICPDRRGRL